MEICISMRHGHLSEKTQSKISSKVERLARIFDRLVSIEVTIDLKDENAPSVDIRVSAEHKHDFVATQQSASLMASLDGALHKAEQQLRRYKEKIQDRHRNPANRRQEIASDTDRDKA